MERFKVSNYNEIKQELINHIIDWTGNCYRNPIQLSLQLDPDASKFVINDITYRGYFNPYEVLLENYEGTYDCAADRYFTTIKDIADALGKTMKELIQEVVDQPGNVDWMDPIDVTWEDVRNYVYSDDNYEQYGYILDDLYNEFVRTDCHELIEDKADRLLDDAIDFMEIKYKVEIDLV